MDRFTSNLMWWQILPSCVPLGINHCEVTIYGQTLIYLLWWMFLGMYLNIHFSDLARKIKVSLFSDAHFCFKSDMTVIWLSIIKIGQNLHFSVQMVWGDVDWQMMNLLTNCRISKIASIQAPPSPLHNLSFMCVFFNFNF